MTELKRQYPEQLWLTKCGRCGKLYKIDKRESNEYWQIYKPTCKCIRGLKVSRG